MIAIKDINQHLKPPEGFEAYSVVAEGAYLRVRYTKAELDVSRLELAGEHYVDIFLNDMGREVLRTSQFYAAPRIPKPEPPVPSVIPEKFWDRMKYYWQEFCGDDSSAF